MKRIVVTGSAGFIGSNFVRYQLEIYADVEILSFDKLTYAGNLDNLKGLDESRHTFIQADVADADAVRDPDTCRRHLYEQSAHAEALHQSPRAAAGPNFRKTLVGFVKEVRFLIDTRSPPDFERPR